MRLEWRRAFSQGANIYHTTSAVVIVNLGYLAVDQQRLPSQHDKIPIPEEEGAQQRARTLVFSTALGAEKMALPIFRTLIQSATGPETKRSPINKDGTYDHSEWEKGSLFAQLYFSQSL